MYHFWNVDNTISGKKWFSFELDNQGAYSRKTRAFLFTLFRNLALDFKHLRLNTIDWIVTKSRLLIYSIELKTIFHPAWYNPEETSPFTKSPTVILLTFFPKTIISPGGLYPCFTVVSRNWSHIFILTNFKCTSMSE